MSYPWDKIPGPDITGVRLGDKVTSISLSGRHVRDEDYPLFSAGQFLADIHATGYRYTDFHRGNYGILPSGGYVIIDPGGWVRCLLDPHNMAGDFLVPALDLKQTQFVAFVCGYVERAHTTIDPKYEQFSTLVLESLGGKIFSCDPRSVGAHQGDALFSTTPNDHKIPLETTSETPGRNKLLKLATACLVLGSDIKRGQPSSFLIALFEETVEEALSAETRVREYLGTYLKSSNCAPLIDELIEDRPLGPIARLAHADLPFDQMRPKSSTIMRLQRLFDSDPEKYRPIRNSFVESALLLAERASTRDPDAGKRSALSFATSAFSIATENSVNAEQYELGHYQLWNRYNAIPIAHLVSLRHGDASTLEDALISMVFYYRAGLFEMAFWGATYHQAKDHEEHICWYAIVFAVECFRRSFLVGWHGLGFVDADDQVPKIYQNILEGVVAANLHAIKALGTTMTERRLIGPVRTLWGSSDRKMIANAKWLEDTDRVLATDAVTQNALKKVLLDGKEYFAVVNFEVATPIEAAKHTRQDIYAPLRQAFDHAWPEKNAGEER